MCMLHLLSFPIRILLEYVTYIHMCTKRYPDIWNFVCTQETQRTHQTKSLFSDSLQRQRDARYGHCEGHNGWWLACRMNVYAGGSDQMLYQHITVLTPDITSSCSSVPPSFLSLVVILVMFWGFLMVRMLFEKNVQKFTSHDLSKLDLFFSLKNSSTRRFFYVDMRKLRSLPPENLKIWISNIVHSER